MAVKNVTPEKEYTFINLPSTHVIQKAYFDIPNNYVYALQLYGERPTKQAVLSRAHISEGTIDFQHGAEKMILSDFGHGETLDMVPNSGVNPTFWITMHAADKPYKGDYWGTQIGKLQFDPNGGSIGFSSLKRLASISHAGKLADGDKARFPLRRVDAALSSNGRYLTILAEGTNGKWQITCYETNVIDRLLNESTTNYISCGQTEMRTRHGADGGALVSSVAFTRHFPWDSMQGMEFSNDLKVYLTGGQWIAGGKGEAPHVLKGNWDWSKYETVSLQVDNVQYAETEGIQLYGDYVYVGVEFHENGTGEARHTIQVFKKSEFTV
ncbi:helveticin J family class III bacteriocin [Lentilactobacillus raoultii]|uniref:Helveticin J family class III bacteriocin n=1 Tax=Lentilactobacillus raoultii TaxID=1987503 RepID=A0ABW3PS83_9LACO|nr:helveticin J family class III bacteriocin [Lentilactobacillus raoultii]